jgi:hypothetical protein
MINLVDVTCELLGSPPVLSEVRIAHYSSVLVLLVFCLSSLCVYCAQCCQYLWISHS